MIDLVNADCTIEGIKQFLPNTLEFLAAYKCKHSGTSWVDTTLCLENAETGESRVIWYKRVDSSIESNCLERDFQRFFVEHCSSLNGREYKTVHSVPVFASWIPDSEHRQEEIVLYRKLEKENDTRVAVVVLYLSDWSIGFGRELWHRRIALTDKLKEGPLKEELKERFDEHVLALRGRDCLIETSPSLLKTARRRWIYRKANTKCAKGLEVSRWQAAGIHLPCMRKPKTTKPAYNSSKLSNYLTTAGRIQERMPDFLNFDNQEQNDKL